MPGRWTRRRVLRALGVTTALGLAGCGERSPSDTHGPTAPGGDGNRATATERSPRPLDTSGAWQQFGADAGHTGVTGATALPESGEAYWQLRRIRSGPPVLADGRLFHYAKLGADTGGRPTVTRTVTEPGTAHPVFGEPAIVARDAGSGRTEWTQSLPNASRGWPAVADGRVVTCVNGQIAAFDAASGDSRWHVDIGEHGPGEPTVAGGTVVVPIQGVVDGASGEYVRRPSIRAYALDDGTERWSVEPPKRANGVAVGDDTVAVVSGSWDETGVVVGLSLADGSEQWRVETPGSFFSSPVAAAGTLYVGSSDDYLRALALADGTERWRRDFDNRPQGVAVDGETAYVAAGSSLYALATSDGTVDWSVVPASDAESIRAVSVGTAAVYAGAIGVEAPLVALDPDDGSERWRHDFPDKVVDGDMVMGGIEHQPVVADGAVFVNAVDGLYAFGPSE